jgi:hypothetical protein
MKRLLNFLLLLGFFISTNEQSAAQSRPNIIIILADDLGFTLCTVLGSL